MVPHTCAGDATSSALSFARLTWATSGMGGRTSRRLSTSFTILDARYLLFRCCRLTVANMKGLVSTRTSPAVAHAGDASTGGQPRTCDTVVGACLAERSRASMPSDAYFHLTRATRTHCGLDSTLLPDTFGPTPPAL